MDSEMPNVQALPSRRELLDRIDRLSISADAKVVLARLAETSVAVGERLVAIGRHVLQFVLDTVRRFPNLTFGVITAMVISALITSIPLLGMVLGPLLTPILLAFGIAKGALADMKEAALSARIAGFEAQMQKQVR